MQDKRTYYLTFGVPLALALVALFLFGVNQLNLCLFATGFCWNFALFAPGVIQKAKRRRYRFSFMGIIYKAYLYSLRLFYVRRWEWIKIAFRVLIPSSFALAVFLILNAGNPLFTVVGALLFEGLLFISPKLLKKIVRDSGSSKDSDPHPYNGPEL